jgi:transposase
MEKQAAGAGSQGAKPRSYTDEYRRQVVDMVVGTGRTATSVGAELGIHHTLISRWIRRYRQPEGTSVASPAPVSPPPTVLPLKPVPVLHADQAAEIARLRRENERLRMERDILKKEIVIFASPSR